MKGAVTTERARTMTTAEAARHFLVPTATIYEWARRGRITRVGASGREAVWLYRELLIAERDTRARRRGSCVRNLGDVQTSCGRSRALTQGDPRP